MEVGKDITDQNLEKKEAISQKKTKGKFYLVPNGSAWTCKQVPFLDPSTEFQILVANHLAVNAKSETGSAK